MSKTNKNKHPKQQLGRERKETRQERRERLEKDRLARQKCLQLLPLCLGVVVLSTIGFALYVRSVPPKRPSIVFRNNTFISTLGELERTKAAENYVTETKYTVPAASPGDGEGEAVKIEF